MAKQGFRILDSDMHVMEPPDLWERYIDSKYRSQAPRGVTSSNVRDLRMVYPDGRTGPERQFDSPGQIQVITLNATRRSIEVTQRADGRRKSSLRPWISKESMSPCSIQLEA